MTEVKSKYAFFQKQAAKGAAGQQSRSSPTDPAAQPLLHPPSSTHAEHASPNASSTPHSGSSSSSSTSSPEGFVHVSPPHASMPQTVPGVSSRAPPQPQPVHIPSRSEKRQRAVEPGNFAPAFPTNIGPSPRAARSSNNKLSAVNTPGGNNVVFHLPKGGSSPDASETAQSAFAATFAHTSSGFTQGAGSSAQHASYAPIHSKHSTRTHTAHTLAHHDPLPIVNPFANGAHMRGKRKHSDPDLHATMTNGRKAQAPSVLKRIRSGITAPFRAIWRGIQGVDPKKDDNMTARFPIASPRTIASHQFGVKYEPPPSVATRVARVFHWKNLLFFIVMTIVVGSFYLWYTHDCPEDDLRIEVDLSQEMDPSTGGGHLHQELHQPLNPASQPSGVVASWLQAGTLQDVEQRYPFLHPVLHFFKRPLDHSAHLHAQQKQVVPVTSGTSKSESGPTHVPFTLVSLLRDMTPEFLAENKASYIFQYNSLLSWVRLTPHVIVYMDSQESCTTLTERKEFKDVQCYAVPCMHDSIRRPLLNCIFDHSHEHSVTEAMGFVNGDIILSPQVKNLVDNVGEKFEKYLVVSRRTDTHLPEFLIDGYIANYHQRLLSDRSGLPFQPAKVVDDAGQSMVISDNVESASSWAGQSGVLHSEFGIDLFLYPKSTFRWMFPNFPPFLAGVYRWDNYFLTKMILHPEVATVDASAFGLLVHQQVDGGKDHSKRSGASVNDGLVKAHLGSIYKIGHIKNVDYVLSGPCPDCALAPNSNASVHVLYAKRATPDGWLAIIHVDVAEHIELNNFVCWSQRTNFRHFILLTRDQSMYDEIVRRGLPVIFLDRNLVDPPSSGAAASSSVESAASTLQRYDFLFSVLKAGYHFFYSSVRAVYLDDPLRALSYSVPLVPPAADAPVAPDANLFDVQLRGNLTHVYSPPFQAPIAMRSSTYGQYFWKQVNDCADMNKHIADSTQWIDCISHNWRILKGGVKKGLLSSWHFTDARDFFDLKESLTNGYYPAMIADQSVAENVDKFSRLATWGLMASHASSPVCKDDLESHKAAVFKPPTEHAETEFRLKVRVLTFNRWASLQRLLDALQTAQYDNDRVDLEISIDYPLNMTDAPTIAEWTQTQLVARSFAWNHGNVEVIQQKTHIGLTGQWTMGWYPADDNKELMLFLEDDTGVSPYYYLWCKRMIQTYYLNPANYDPNMYGFALQTQHTILGETLASLYGTKKVPDLLNATYDAHGSEGIDREYFRYQIVGTWGGLFFPQHWREFLIWLREKQFVHALGTSPSFQPCVPGLLSNAWWQKKPHKVWSQWFIRFAFEKGWYNLYTNFPDQLSLVGNFREGGENFAKTKGLMNEMVDRINTPPGSPLWERILHTPLPVPTSKIPLFDLHFNEITSAPTLHSRLSVWGNPALVNQCITMGELKKQKKAAADAEKSKAERHAREEAQRAADKSEQISGGILAKVENTMVELDAKKATAGGTDKKKAEEKKKTEEKKK